MIEMSPSTPKFLDRSNPVYRDLHRACNTVYQELHGQGVGTNVKRTATFSPEEEEKLWTTCVISILNPKAFQRAVFSISANISASEVEKNRDDLVLHSSFDLVILIVTPTLSTALRTGQED